ncbi:MAG: response regulator, partial [Gemmatimonadetes bacterium]|nr:response regulator [Gemmatimonadota bacterium]
MSRRLPPVLLVEDNPDHALLVQRAFKEVKVTHPVRVLERVEDAIAYLAGSPPYQDRHAHPLPALVVLDITLLGGTGFDILDWMRGRPELSALPVVVLTVSADMATRERAFGLGALDYVVKRRSFKQLVSTVDDWAERWLRGAVAQAEVMPERATRTPGAGAIPMQVLRGSDEITRSIRPVLVVQEDAEQGLLVQIGFQEARVGNPVTVLMSSELAIAYLGGEAPYDDRSRHPLPALLLVDLGPKERAGLEVLEWL